ncbi:TRNA (Adenine-N(1)-)-methyltransferase [Penicillium digitatum PHI26]|uniref:tRNA (adenine(58)-N(1))-methyltransferase catalytic subunit TRM61 n=3 Tax=Penicillium digitatum TaxID=36651 RepID=K9FD32_PEND2|nr:TRNA (Adenine-N(1)-)-methyltransferase [Penicillium digitatum Pd1]EKV07159.1 TRNA (Adenine-N(1)-)-methyltransferase [Penicillium digitatum PHI26]EKV14175.1 TRNA (Adenine-N(1)-)-methyltransferase [Penicillium digitatum Pd1]
MEILESGTGHGSLTLHLARAIHAANTTPPPLPSRSQINYLEGRITRPSEKDTEPTGETPAEQTADPVQEEWDAWRAQRNAVIHTVDVSSKFSALAEKNIRGFRRGIYTGNTDFYVGPVENWIAQQKQLRKKTGLASLTGGNPVDPFLSHIILDMPSSNLRIPHVTPMLKRDGLLVVFVPSITQIGECLQLIRDQRLPLIQEKVIELGSGISGGRTWDVRFATKKSGADPASWATPSDADVAAPVETDEQSTASDTASEMSTEEPSKEGGSVLVCRPKVGLRIQGGGFVAVWRRIEDR